MRMPVLFVGHGSPMNIVARNEFTKALIELARTLPKPRAILAVSAHWETAGTLAQASPAPETIHDFYGFPEELYETGYRSVGASLVAADLERNKHLEISPTLDWGLDHGTWAVLYHMYPNGDIPVTQLSLDKRKDFVQHMNLGKELRYLRDQGVLILASGNLVHNLRAVHREENAIPHDWTIEFDARAAEALRQGNTEAFLKPETLGGESLFRMAHPSLEHYIPILYALGAATETDKVRFVYEGLQNASVSMRTLLLTSRPEAFAQTRE